MLPPLGKFSDLRRTIIQKHGSICLYVAKHDAPLLNILFQGGGSAEFIDLEGFHLQLVRPVYVWDTVKYTLKYGEFSVRLNVIGIDSVPCGPELMYTLFILYGKYRTVSLHSLLHHFPSPSRRS